MGNTGPKISLHPASLLAPIPNPHHSINLRLHQRIIPPHVSHDRRRNKLAIPIRIPRSTQHNRSIGLVYHPLQAIKMPFRNNPRVRIGLFGAIGVELVIRRSELLDKCVLAFLRDEDIVRCDTGLSGVGSFAPENATGRDLEVRFGVDDDRALATELRNILSVPRVGNQ
jgi:hypothetical protein